MTDQKKAFVLYQLMNPVSPLSTALKANPPSSADDLPAKVQAILTKPVAGGGGEPSPGDIGFGMSAGDLDLSGLSDLWKNGNVDRNPEAIAAALAIGYPGGGPCPPFAFDYNVSQALA